MIPCCCSCRRRRHHHVVHHYQQRYNLLLHIVVLSLLSVTILGGRTPSGVSSSAFIRTTTITTANQKQQQQQYLVVVSPTRTTTATERRIPFDYSSSLLSSINSIKSRRLTTPSSSSSSTQLSMMMMMMPPPLIIGPMIKKMREDQDKKNKPMIQAGEADDEAPGLRVGKTAWKWPIVWPYEKSFFVTTKDVRILQNKRSINQMTNLLSGGGPNSVSGTPGGPLGAAFAEDSSATTVTEGGAAPTTTEEVAKDDEDEEFDPIKFWGTEVANVTTNIDSGVITKLQDHLAFYMNKNRAKEEEEAARSSDDDDSSTTTTTTTRGIKILEFGAGENSYLPPSDVIPTISKHVGISASMSSMELNPSLTDRYVVDINDVIVDRDINSEVLRRIAQEEQDTGGFDYVLITNTIEYLTNPREVFRTAWYMLKPGGMMFVSFTGRNDQHRIPFKDATTKVWTDYNDDQHMWMTGSFFYFSASDGWEDLLGFDISVKPTDDDNNNGGTNNALSKITSMISKDKDNKNMFVVQATKASQDNEIRLDTLTNGASDNEPLERSIKSLCWMLPTLEARDKDLIVPRLTRSIETAEDPYTMKYAIEKNLKYLPVVYEHALSKMDQYAFTYTMQAQLATDLVCDIDFNGSEQQVDALRQGLGLAPPSTEFWGPVGELTSNMNVEDKISLLAYIVPRFGHDSKEDKENIQAFVTGLQPTFALLRSKCPDFTEDEIQLMGTEFLASEILPSSKFSRTKSSRTTAEEEEEEVTSVTLPLDGGSVGTEGVGATATATVSHAAVTTTTTETSSTLLTTSREEFAIWLNTMTYDEIRELLDYRKSLRTSAKENLKLYREERKDAKSRMDTLRSTMDEQMKLAAQERSMVFNPRTEKMEIFDNPNNKNKKRFFFF